MNNYNNISFKVIKIFLNKNSINFKTKLDDKTVFNKINSIEKASSNDLTFFHNDKYLKLLSKTKAKACLIQNKYLSYLNNECIPIIVEDPYLSYALITNIFVPSNKSNGEIHKNVIFGKNVNIGNNVQVNSNVIIKDNCSIDNNVIILENSIIGPNVKIDKETIVMSNCVISNTQIGEKMCYTTRSCNWWQRFWLFP